MRKLSELLRMAYESSKLCDKNGYSISLCLQANSLLERDFITMREHQEIRRFCSEVTQSIALGILSLAYAIDSEFIISDIYSVCSLIWEACIDKLMELENEGK